jgi:hypothetical protein
MPPPVSILRPHYSKKPLAQPGGPRKSFLAWYGLQMSDPVSETIFGDTEYPRGTYGR